MGLNLSDWRGAVRRLWGRNGRAVGRMMAPEGRGRSVFGGPEPRLRTWPVGCCALASGDVPWGDPGSETDLSRSPSPPPVAEAKWVTYLRNNLLHKKPVMYYRQSAQ